MSALVIGTQRPEVALLLELAEPHKATSIEEKGMLMDDLWRMVEVANNECPAHARVARSQILVADKPFLRAGKGTVQRKPTLELFADKIETLYANIGDEGRACAEAKPTTLKSDNSVMFLNSTEGTSRERKREVLCQLVKEVYSLDSISPEDDFFRLGMDSIQVLHLVHKIRSALGSQVEPRSIYRYTTVQALMDSGKL